MEKSKIIPFDAVVEDQITGFTGIVTSRMEHMHNCVRYEVKPPAKDKGVLPKGKVIDGPHLKIMSLPKGKKVTETPNAFEFGVKVRDKVTGFEGIVLARIKYKYTSDRYAVQPRIGKSGEYPEIETFDEEDLKQIDPPPKKKKSSGRKRPNGPHDSGTKLRR